MLILWLGGALRDLFGTKTDASQSETVKAKMEKCLGSIIIIDHTNEGGKARAFFERQTLVGYAGKSTMKHATNAQNVHSMAEAIGTGASRETAITDLWDKLTTLSNGENIAQVICEPDKLGSSGWLSCLRLLPETNQFRHEDDISSARIPKRPAFIRDFLASQTRPEAQGQPKAAEPSSFLHAMELPKYKIDF